MFLFMRIYMYHDVPHIWELVEYETLDFGRNVVGLLHRHIGIHVYL